MSNQITTLRLPDGREVAFVDWTDRPLFSTIEILHGSNTQEMNFFQYVVGDSVPAFAPVAVAAARTATELDTNIASPGGMSDTEEMFIYAVRPEVFRLEVSDANAPDFSAPVPIDTTAPNTNEPIPTPIMLAALNLQTLLSVEISQKVYSQAGFGYFNFGAGVLAMLSAGFDGDIPIANNGLQSQEAVRSFALPMHIGGTEKFRAFLTFIDDGQGAGIELGAVGWGESDKIDSSTPVAERFARIRLYFDGLYKRPTS